MSLRMYGENGPGLSTFLSKHTKKGGLKAAPHLVILLSTLELISQPRSGRADAVGDVGSQQDGTCACIPATDLTDRGCMEIAEKIVKVLDPETPIMAEGIF